MKAFFTTLFLFNGMFFPAHAQVDAWSYADTDLRPGESVPINVEERQKELHPPSEAEEENDPLEPVNRVIFDFNETVDGYLLEPVSVIYKEAFPEFVRERVGYVLRNLSEPIVLVNNLLQGELEDAEGTLRRFLINSTVGVAGIFDVSTDLDIPYKKKDFGLTLASWGCGPGPYLVLPILGPSNLRDSFGRIGDYAFDPINWWAYTTDNAVYSNARTGVQIVDAKTDNLEVINDLRKNSIDYYYSLRAWYNARRKDLILKEREALDTPRPDDDD